MKDYSRNVSMLCSICGCSDFKFDSKYENENEEMPDDAIMTCADCGHVFTKAQLLEENQEIINANIEDMKDEIMSEVEKNLSKELRKLGK